MSDRLKSTHNVSNEEVIDDLTKDLRRTLSSGDGDDFVGDPGCGEEHVQRTSGDAAKESLSDDIPLSDDDLDKHSKGESDSEDSDISSMDEESLRESEMELTDDQKEQRRIIAEELKTAGNNAFKDAEYEKSIDKYTEGNLSSSVYGGVIT
ncbi:jg3012 [Pararge aegeria aegeria]|uniref:Jg3012 protein n=1 Tax=Pararge aegeria aegeria TaxID=348720 RepID=A0A8S4QJU4_9NEOP|nr:jg3012 [Pararge aegeria aegeria]